MKAGRGGVCGKKAYFEGENIGTNVIWKIAPPWQKGGLERGGSKQHQQARTLSGGGPCSHTQVSMQGAAPPQNGGPHAIMKSLATSIPALPPLSAQHPF